MSVRVEDGYVGTWDTSLPEPLFRRAVLAALRLGGPGHHFWVEYSRGLTAGRWRCARCGVTVGWDSRTKVPRRCEDMAGFLLAASVMGS